MLTHSFIIRSKKSLIMAILCSVVVLHCAQSQARDNAEHWLNAISQDSNFWIGDTGPTGPIFSGPQQYPFICTTIDNGLGQPLIDNQAGIGNAVFPEVGGQPDFSATPVGYSRLCSIATRVDMFTTAQRQTPFCYYLIQRMYPPMRNKLLSMIN